MAESGNNNYDAIITGSGLSGLLCGYILAKEGFNVCILEKHHQPGGNLQTFTRDGHKFETGVHYSGGLGPGKTLNRYWNYFGLTHSLKLQQLDVDCFDKISIGDCEFPLAQGSENFIDRLLPYFPGAGAELADYLLQTAGVVADFPLYNLELPAGHNEQHHMTRSAPEFFDKFSRCLNPASGIPLSSILAGNNFLYGGSPLAPLHAASLISHSLISGAYRIIGGSDQVTRILTDGIREQGGTVLTRQEAISITRSGATFTTGTSKGESFNSGMIISGIHPAATLSMMPADLVRPAYRNRIASLSDTVSSFILYLTLKPRSFPYLNYNFYHHESHEPWNETSLKGSSWPGMFLLSTACHEPAQEFAETATILTYMQAEEVARWNDTSTGKRGMAYQDFRNERAEKLMQLVLCRFPALKGAVSHMEISTPLTYRDYTGTPGGSLYGIQKSYRDPVMTTVLPRTKIPNFYFTGQNTNLHGLLGVTIGAVITCGEILGLGYILKKIRSA